MATFSQGGTLGTAIETAEIVAGAVTEAKLEAALISRIGAKATSLILKPIWLPGGSTDGLEENTLSANTTLVVGKVFVAREIDANKLSFVAGAVVAGGGFNIFFFC